MSHYQPIWGAQQKISYPTSALRVPPVLLASGETGGNRHTGSEVAQGDDEVALSNCGRGITCSRIRCGFCKRTPCATSEQSNPRTTPNDSVISRDDEGPVAWLVEKATAQHAGLLEGRIGGGQRGAEQHVRFFIRRWISAHGRERGGRAGRPGRSLACARKRVLSHGGPAFQVENAGRPEVCRRFEEVQLRGGGKRDRGTDGPRSGRKVQDDAARVLHGGGPEEGRRDKRRCQVHCPQVLQVGDGGRLGVDVAGHRGCVPPPPRRGPPVRERRGRWERPARREVEPVGARQDAHDSGALKEPRRPDARGSHVLGDQARGAAGLQDSLENQRIRHVRLLRAYLRRAVHHATQPRERAAGLVGYILPQEFRKASLLGNHRTRGANKLWGESAEVRTYQWYKQISSCRLNHGCGCRMTTRSGCFLGTRPVTLLFSSNRNCRIGYMYIS